jgi:hypothetical protein
LEELVPMLKASVEKEPLLKRDTQPASLSGCRLDPDCLNQPRYATWTCDCGKVLNRERSFTPSINWSCKTCQDKQFDAAFGDGGRPRSY